MPKWTTQSEKSEACYELFNCGCKSVANDFATASASYKAKLRSSDDAKNFFSVPSSLY